MDQRYKLFRPTILLLILFALASKSRGQCSVDYTTYSYFCDLDTLILEAVPLTGTGPFTFLWETGETTQQILIPLALGDYMVTMTDATGCVAIINCHVKPFPDVIYYPFNQNACEGDTVTIWLDWFRDSLPGATYLWSNGATTPTIQITDDIVWSVTITDPGTGCEYVIPPNLFEFHYTPYPTIVGPNLLCDGNPIELSVTGGPFGAVVWYPEFLYQETLTVYTPGEYIVWTSSPTAGYCWHQDTIVITTGDMPPPELTGPPELCPGQSGTVSITNFQEYESFIWSTGQTTSSFTVNIPATYAVTVTNEEGCSATASITVDVGNGPDLQTDETGATCGQSNGSIDLSVVPAQSNTYQWSNNATTQDLNNIAPGNYAVTVTDANGCTATTNTVVPDIPVVITITETISGNTSCTDPNGSISIVVSPAGSYTYNWSNGETTANITDLSPGQYSVTVSTGLNCIETEDYAIDNLSGAADLLETIVPTTCGESNGSISITTSGGQGPFEYTWSNGSTTSTINNVPAGSYSLTVTGTDGCISTANYTLPNSDPQINISGIVTPNTSCDAPNGEIDITVSPANIYEFSWSNGSVSEDLTGIGAGTYTITATLGNTCTSTASFTVTNENIPFSINGTVTPNTSCDIPNGAIDLTITPPETYTIIWSNGSNQPVIQNLEAGSYEVTVTNSSGCSLTSLFNVGNEAASFEISGLAIVNTSCSVPNGQLDISVTPPGVYSFVWSNGATTEDLTGIGAGEYVVTVTNTNACSDTSSFNILDESAPFSVTGTVQQNTSCTNPTGSIDLSITPGSTYTYQWSTNETTEDIFLLSGGTYSVTVSDLNSCSSTATYTVESLIELPTISFTQTNENCGLGNGSIDITVTPAGSIYSWSNGAVSEDIQNLSAGMYAITVTAPNGCTIADTIDLLNSSNNFSISANTNDNTSCNAPNGSISLNIIPAGSYTISWSTGANTADLQNLAGGAYQVTVTDASGCVSNSSFLLIDLTQFPVVTGIILPATCGLSNGGILLDVLLSAGNSFIWSNGATIEDLQNLPGGSYTVTVTSNNGCTTTASFTVPDQQSTYSILSETTSNSSCADFNGAIDITIIPSGTYTYSWSNGNDTEDLFDAAAGLYVLTVTDENNCTSTLEISVEGNTIDPEISYSTTPATCGLSNGAIDVTISATEINTFLWSDGHTTEDLNDLLPGIYQLTVTSDLGCIDTARIEIANQNSNFTIISDTGDNTSCTNFNGYIDLTVIPAGSYQFFWSNGALTEDLSSLDAGVYEVTVTDALNCSTSDSYLIIGTTTLPVVTGSTSPVTCGGNNGKIDITVTPADSYDYQWSDGSKNEDLSEVSPGNYTVTVTDMNGCSAYESFIVDDSPVLELHLEADLTSISAGDEVTCTLQINSSMDAVDHIDWSPVELMSCNGGLCMEQTFLVQESMEITVNVFDTFGCMTSAFLFLDVNAENHVFIPNVFTPNNDGSNDMFTVYANDEVEEVVLLEIFNRWGDLLFVNDSFPPNEENYGWDGIYYGKMMNPDVFAYRAVVRYGNGELHYFKGDVTLIR